MFAEAAALGVLQVHFSGGEPLVRRDLAELVAGAAKAGLYVNLITSGIRLDAERLAPSTRLFTDKILDISKILSISP